MKKTLKHLTLSAAMIACSGLTVSSMAATKATAPTGTGASGSLTQVVKQIYGQIQAGYTEANARLQQFDSYVDSFIAGNTAPVAPSASMGLYTTAAAKLTTVPGAALSMPVVAPAVQSANSAVTNYNVLSQIPFQASEAGANNPTQVYSTYKTAGEDYLPWFPMKDKQPITGSLLSAADTTKKNSPNNYAYMLTNGINASDSFLEANPNNNGYFNFMNFYAPTDGAYSIMPTSGQSSDLTMARGYAEYLSLAAQPIATGVGEALQSYVDNDGKITNKDNVDALAKIMDGDDYQNFLLLERHYNASRSMINGLLSQMWVERAPVANAATTVLNSYNDNPTEKDAVKQQYFSNSNNASPLQLERYNRMHRVEDKNWYNQMRTASPATVAREQLFVSAELLAAQQQAHEDREKQLLVSLLNAQTNLNNATKSQLTMSEQKLEKDLCAASGNKASAICAQAATASNPHV